MLTIYLRGKGNFLTTKIYYFNENLGGNVFVQVNKEDLLTEAVQKGTL